MNTTHLREWWKMRKCSLFLIAKGMQSFDNDDKSIQPYPLRSYSCCVHVKSLLHTNCAQLLIIFFGKEAIVCLLLTILHRTCNDNGLCYLTKTWIIQLQTE